MPGVQLQGKETQDVHRCRFGAVDGDDEEEEKRGERDNAQDAVIDKRQIAHRFAPAVGNQAEKEAAQHEKEADATGAVLYPQLGEIFWVHPLAVEDERAVRAEEMEDEDQDEGEETQVVQAGDVADVLRLHTVSLGLRRVVACRVCRGWR